MPKKLKKQPYVLYCTERQQTVPSLAGKSLPELIEICAEEWQELEPTLRQRYVDMAKEYNAKGGVINVDPNEHDLTGKFDSTGRSLLALKEEQRQKEFWTESMEADIGQRIKRAMSKQRLSHMNIHVLSVNTWLELSTGEVIPSEVGIVRMSVFDGITHRFNQMINPGPLPVGYKAEAMINSEKFHQIWLDNNCLSDDYLEIVEKLKEEVTVRADDEAYVGEDIQMEERCAAENIPMTVSAKSAKQYKLTPIYVMSSDNERAAKSLQWLCKKANVDYEFTLYDLPFFFKQMIDVAPQTLPQKISLSVAEAHLRRDVFLYVNGVSCEYHESVESCSCAGGVASRLAFIMCDFFCQLFGISPVEGRHVPNGINVDDLDPSFDASLAQTQSFRRFPRLRPELESVPPKMNVESFQKQHMLSKFIRRSGPESFAVKTDEEIAAGRIKADLPASVLAQMDIEDLTDTTYYSFDTSNEAAGHSRVELESTTDANCSFVSANDTITE